ncbi:MAG: CDP-glucose 4,6-dehydratase [Candidatus Marinimicrobia bacterium]|nr:CDP-glucose 4,6-dehydratase [Candidatus Neomarinimicrobiota bacterium]
MNKNNIFSNKKVLITGHTGFKGSWLSLWLHELGAKLYGISLDVPTNPSNFESSMISGLIKDIRLDIRDFEKLNSTIKEIKPDFIFHLAAQPLVNISLSNPLETYKTNTIGTLNILESIRVSLKKCIAIFITSDKVYDNQEWAWGYRETDKLGGSDPYSSSKACAELSISSYYRSYFKGSSDIKICSVRAGNVIGGGDWALNRIVPDCIRSWLQNKPVLLRNPNSTRPWQHVLEPLSGYLLVASELTMKDSINGGTYNFGPSSEQNKSVLELVKCLSKYLPNLNYNFDNEFLNFNSESKLLKLNCDKAQYKLGWLPTLNFNQTLELTASWYEFFRSNPCKTREISLDQIKLFSKLSENTDFLCD